jgi:hypothetical protein
VFKSAYEMEDFTTHLSVGFVSEYADGKLQVRGSEFWHAVKQDSKYNVVVSSVEGKSWCAVDVIFPGDGDCQCNVIAVVKAGVNREMSVEQLKTPMFLFSHGAKGALQASANVRISHKIQWSNQSIQTRLRTRLKPHSDHFIHLLYGDVMAWSDRHRQRLVRVCHHAIVSDS